MAIGIPGIDIQDEPPDEDLSPGELHDRWEAATNLDVAALERLRSSEANATYLEENSKQAQTGNEPLTDAIRLAETPASEWSDEADGFDEVAEAQEALDYGRRSLEQPTGENVIFEGDGVALTKREIADARWGFDRDPSDGWP
jgi:hypothetical protein